MPDTIQIADTIQPPVILKPVNDSVISVPQNSNTTVADTSQKATDTAQQTTNAVVKPFTNQVQQAPKKQAVITFVKEQKTKGLPPSDSSIYLNEYHNFFYTLTPEVEYRQQKVLPLIEKSDVHKFVSDNMLAKERKSTFENSWTLGLFFVIAGATIWLRLFNTKYLEMFFRAIINYQVGVKLYRDHNTVINKIAFVLNILFVLSISFFLLLLSRKFNVLRFHENFINNYFILLALFIGVILFRIVILKIIGLVFNSQPVANEYLFNILLSYKIGGLLLIPIVIGEYYISNQAFSALSYIGLGIVLTVFIIRITKGFRLILRSNIFLFYIILYLCTLEILPVLVVWKVILNVSVLGS